MSIFCCFKYRPLSSYTLKGLQKSELYFCPRDLLNDPDDCNLDVERIVSGMLKDDAISNRPTLERLFADKSLLRGLRHGAGTLGICSFSLIANSTLMWAHYAGAHTGICLRFDFPETFLKDDENYPFMGVAGVRYGVSTLISWIKENIGIYERSRKEFGMALSRELLTCKSDAWSYEKEVRIIAMHQGCLAIPQEFLTHIIFGMKTKPDDRDRVKSILSHYAHEIRTGVVVRADSDDGFDTVEI